MKRLLKTLFSNEFWLVCVYITSAGLAALMLFGLVSVVLADVEERVAPIDDSAKWHISVVGEPTDKQFCWLLTAFRSNKTLAKVKNQVHFHEITTGSKAYRDRYDGTLHGLPTLRVQNGAGVVMYEVCSDDVPTSAAALVRDIERAVNAEVGRLEQCGPNGRRRWCPRPKPEPEPKPEPNPFEVPPLPVLVEPEPEPEPEQSNTLPILAGLVGAAAAGVAGVRKKLKAA